MSRSSAPPPVSTMPRSATSAPSSGGVCSSADLHGADDALQRLLQRLEDLVAVQREAARHALGEIAALDGDLVHVLARIRRADLVLDAFGGGFADQYAVVAAHVVGDRLVEPVAADAHATPRRRCRSARSPRLRTCRRRCRAPSSRAPRAPACRRRSPRPSALRRDRPCARRRLRRTRGSRGARPGSSRTARRRARAGSGGSTAMPCAFLMKCWSIFSVTVKSAITPSFSGRMAVMCPGVRPSMFFASAPPPRCTLPPRPGSSRIATTEGSLSTMPLPRT